jgi:hypothetical protein
MDQRHGKGLIEIELPDENFVYGKKSEKCTAIKRIMSRWMCN